jgi:chromosomal replication initiation ATPase DnaA
MTPPSPYVIPGIQNPRQLNAHDVLEAAVRHYHISKEEIRLVKRSRRLVMVRRAIVWVCRNKLKMTLKQIARFLKQDHTTVIYTLEQAQNHIDVYPEYREELDRFVNKLYS